MGGWGNRGKGARQGSVRPDSARAATVAPCLVTAAVPRDLRVDPCERKSKREPWRLTQTPYKQPSERSTMSAVFVERFHLDQANGNGHAVCAVVPVCVVVPVRKSRKDVSSRAGAKECCLCCLQADIIAMACPLLTF